MRSGVVIKLKIGYYLFISQLCCDTIIFQTSGFMIYEYLYFVAIHYHNGIVVSFMISSELHIS